MEKQTQTEEKLKIDQQNVNKAKNRLQNKQGHKISKSLSEVELQQSSSRYNTLDIINENDVLYDIEECNEQMSQNKQEVIQDNENKSIEENQEIIKELNIQNLENANVLKQQEILQINNLYDKNDFHQQQQQASPKIKPKKFSQLNKQFKEDYQISNEHEDIIADMTNAKQQQPQIFVNNSLDENNQIQPQQNKNKVEEQKKEQKAIKGKSYQIYDFIKVRVKLEEHSYVFSRFLISRILMVCMISNLEALKIARELKKQLVVQNLITVQQQKLEEILFQLIQQHGFSQHYINRYVMISRFYQKRVPLIILISGTSCIGKSIVATYLAERLNISNVLQTSIVEIVMNSMNLQQFDNLNDIQNDNEMIKSFDKKCLLIRTGVQTDIKKCLVEGKAVIIEGQSVKLDLYVVDKAKQEITQEEINSKIEKIMNYIEGKSDLIIKTAEDLQQFNISDPRTRNLKLIMPNLYESPNEKQIESISKIQDELTKFNQKEVLIVPILLVLNKQDHQFALENKFSSQLLTKNKSEQYLTKTLQKLQIIQQYLLKFLPICTVIPVNINNVDKTISIIHQLILDQIEGLYKRNQF